MHVRLTRRSVAMGDDVTAPNAAVAELADPATVGDLAAWIIDNHYPAYIAGGRATWVLCLSDHRDRPAAVIAQQWPSARFLLPADTSVEGLDEAYLEYLAQQDPDLTFDALAARPDATWNWRFR